MTFDPQACLIELKNILIKHVDNPNRDGCLKLLFNNELRILQAPGSKSKHQVYPGGWLKPNVNVMRLAISMYPVLSEVMGDSVVDFSVGDVILGIFWHDMEKPRKYVSPTINFQDEKEKLKFVLNKTMEYDVRLAPVHVNIIKYIHREGSEYNPDQRVMLPATALAHAMDTISARIDN